MNRDDPFAEPTDTDRTVIRPNPAGRRPVAPKPMPPPGASRSAEPASQAPQAPKSARATSADRLGTAGQQGDGGVAIASIATGLNPLNAAATSLFSLIGRLRNRAQHPDPGQLRESVIAEIRTFESRALKAGVAEQTMKVARYALCATIDDVVLNTPWGGDSAWTQQSLVGAFHKETHGGDRFYDLLTRLEKEPAENRDLLEFLYVCLALGFEGRLRVEPRGADKHLAIRDKLAKLIRTHRGSAETDLSPSWKGLEVAHRPLSTWTPIWLISGLLVGAICLTFFGFSQALTGQTDWLRGQLSALDVDGPVTLARAAPPPPPPPPLQDTETLETFLAPEIAEGLVTVLANANALTIRITGESMFRPGSDSLETRFTDLVDRVADGLNREEGRIIVAGHSDNVPISNARFPSNLHLSLARARSVMDRITPALDDETRISAEGRADKEPIADNETPSGRAQNRRIEIILVQAG